MTGAPGCPTISGVSRVESLEPAAPGIGDELGDAELEQLALAADPDAEIPDDAVPFGADQPGSELLPEWYMPPPRGVRRSLRARVIVGTIIVALAAVNGVGLCVTYGLPEIAW